VTLAAIAIAIELAVAVAFWRRDAIAPAHR
jgi:hypothetical protein